MPLYEYRCTACGRSVEALRPVGDHLELCPICRGELRRVFGTPLFRFRPPGWKPYSPETSAKAELIKEEIAVSE